jgi:hypothetical protein
MPLRVRSSEGLGVVALKDATSSAWRQVTGDTELVPLWISEVRAIVVPVVLGPQAGRAFGRATVGKSYRVGFVYQGSTLCEKGDHLAVPSLVCVLVVRRANEEERPWTWT